jgi:hypothetical protein
VSRAKSADIGKPDGATRVCVCLCVCMCEISHHGAGGCAQVQSGARVGRRGVGRSVARSTAAS